jgi:hypothetical protein
LSSGHFGHGCDIVEHGGNVIDQGQQTGGGQSVSFLAC